MGWISNLIDAIYDWVINPKLENIKYRTEQYAKHLQPKTQQQREFRNAIYVASRMRDKMIKQGFGPRADDPSYFQKLKELNRSMITWYMPARFRRPMFSLLGLSKSDSEEEEIQIQLKYGIRATDNDLLQWAFVQ